MTAMRDSERSRTVIDGWRSFLDASPAMTEGDGSGWAATVYQRAVDEVPAYRAFLVEQGLPVDPARFTDFADLPLVTKENYLRRFPLPSRCRGGRLAAGDMLAVSSGSSGSPTIWPRTVLDELPVALRFEQVFRGSFRADERRTLAVVCFPLGSWVGGMYTTSCCRHLAAKGYPITVVAPGNDVAEILRVVREIGAMFDQVVLLGYPPFVKGVLDIGAADGLDWAGLHVRLVFAGEVFSEQWRDLVTARIGSRSPWLDTASLYGTADAGVLGTETPVSIAIRRFLAETPAAAQELFGQARLPTLVQYEPDRPLLRDRRRHPGFHRGRDTTPDPLPPGRRRWPGRPRRHAGVLPGPRVRPGRPGASDHRQAGPGAAVRLRFRPEACSRCRSTVPTCTRRTSPSGWSNQTWRSGRPASSC